jgi:hypothetical protein
MTGQKEKRFIGLKSILCNLNSQLNWQNLAKILARGMENTVTYFPGIQVAKEKKGL